MSPAAAFFDLDRTLIAGSSGFHWARAGARAGIIPRRRLYADAWANLQFRLQGSTDEATAKVQERVSAIIAGRRAVEFARLAPMVLAGVLPRVYPRMLQVAYDHQDAGRPVYICTAATQGTADMLATVLGFDGGLGTQLEEEDGVLTGRIQGPFNYGEGKPVRMRELAGEERIDLAASWAYSDSASDLPMLRAVGHPVAVNPDAELARVAREEGWEVMRFETLGRRLKIGAAAVAVAAAGTVARKVVRR
ncbi:HAD family hydrolase [Capillimicrobium parvum]|uniref:Phosphoserine phosphatase SerB1 n=1 Tax=Capillimicrobium parvum TaxID=2884022 RepID=A0A9E6XV55_9ACTN|nr:HAD-IB family hydrolase [Capillimicrobium parvum]UGS35034.1 Phosphoserine phosphatase SerB1 [Capillimicrobium parvum]